MLPARVPFQQKFAQQQASNQRTLADRRLEPKHDSAFLRERLGVSCIAGVFFRPSGNVGSALAATLRFTASLLGRHLQPVAHAPQSYISRCFTPHSGCDSCASLSGTFAPLSATWTCSAECCLQWASIHHAGASRRSEEATLQPQRLSCDLQFNGCPDQGRLSRCSPVRSGCLSDRRDDTCYEASIASLRCYRTRRATHVRAHADSRIMSRQPRLPDLLHPWIGDSHLKWPTFRVRYRLEYITHMNCG